MAVFIQDKKEIETYPGVDLSKVHIDPYILGSLVVEATGSYDVAKQLAYQKARRKVEAEVGSRFPFLQIQDPMPSATPKTVAPMKTETKPDGRVEVTTLDAMLDCVGYTRFHGMHDFNGPALIYDTNQVPGLEIKRFSQAPYSKSVKGRAVAPDETKVKAMAQNDAYRQIRRFLMEKRDVFVYVPDKETLAGILEVKEGDKLEKVYNVYAFKKGTRIFDKDPEDDEDSEE